MTYFTNSTTTTDQPPTYRQLLERNDELSARLTAVAAERDLAASDTVKLHDMLVACEAERDALKASAREVARANEILDGTEVIDELWADRCEAADAALSKLAAMVKEGE